MWCLCWFSQAWRCSNATMHWNPSEHRRKGQSCMFGLTWVSLTSLREHSQHGKNEGCTYMRYYIFAFIQWNLKYMFVFSKRFPSPTTSVKHPPLLSEMCYFSLGSGVMTAFTHNVCALFCKSMVINVCLLLMYIHSQTYFRHSMFLCVSLWAPALLLDQFPLAKKKEFCHSVKENRE